MAMGGGGGGGGGGVEDSLETAMMSWQTDGLCGAVPTTHYPLPCPSALPHFPFLDIPTAFPLPYTAYPCPCHCPCHCPSLTSHTTIQVLPAQDPSTFSPFLLQPTAQPQRASEAEPNVAMEPSVEEEAESAEDGAARRLAGRWG